MKFEFSKYHGTGNDFIIADDRQAEFPVNNRALINHLCHRHFGIGADGLILIGLPCSHGSDFEMQYFNSDGQLSSMCGNGGRCAAHFARQLGLGSEEKIDFHAIDGMHEARFTTDGSVSLSMSKVTSVKNQTDGFELDTGSPHYVRFLPEVDSLDVNALGGEIRYSPPYRQKGINVNFASMRDGHLQVRTYERGVENETLSCGTGVTAAAIAHLMHDAVHPGQFSLPVKTPGGNLEVRLTFHHNGTFDDIWLVGPAVKVFSGSVEIS